MATLKELIEQKEALERKIEEAKKTNREEGLAKLREVMEQYGLTAADLNGSVREARASTKGKSTGKVAAKYKNPETGDTWTGRGLKPKWLKAALEGGKKIEDFAI